MLLKIVRLTIIGVFAVTGLFLLEMMTPYLSTLFKYDVQSKGLFGVTVATTLAGVVGVLLFGFIGYLLTPSIIRNTMRVSELAAMLLSKLPTVDIFITAFGVIVGLIVANLFGTPFSRLPFVGPYIPLIMSIFFALVGAKVALLKRNDIISFFSHFPLSRVAGRDKGSRKLLADDKNLGYCNNKILDTSVLIDGRIAEIIKTGFLEGPIVVAQFVLEELQKVADSSDTLKRNRGRRGLDIVKEIQSNGVEQVLISDIDYDDLTEVDAKLLRLAKEIGGVVATNDFNLSKVAEIQGVRILNVNDLANAVKPAVLPGEEMTVFLAKEGKEHGQAIAYLDDGTMIVVEGGRRSVNSNVSVIVTSVLQTSAGRMIFAKMK